MTRTLVVTGAGDFANVDKTVLATDARPRFVMARTRAEDRAREDIAATGGPA